MLRATGSVDKLEVWVPVNVSRLVSMAQRRFRCGPAFRTVSDLTPPEVISLVTALTASLPGVLPGGQDAISGEARHNAVHLFSIILRAHLASKVVIEQYRMTRDALLWVLSEVERRYCRALCPAGILGSLQ